MVPDTNTLTQEVYDSLKQGSKIVFKWHGSDMLYIGRIEIDEVSNIKYFVAEHNYKDDILLYEGLDTITASIVSFALRILKLFKHR